MGQQLHGSWSYRRIFTFLAILPYEFHSGRGIKISDAPEYWKSRTISVYLYNNFWEILCLKWQRMCINSSTRASQQFRNYRFLLFLLLLQRVDNLHKWSKSTNSFTFVNWLARTQNNAHAQLQTTITEIVRMNISLHRHTANLLGGGVESVKLYDNKTPPGKTFDNKCATLGG